MPTNVTPARALLRWLVAFAAILIFAVAPVEFHDDDTVRWVVIAAAAFFAMNAGLVFSNRKIHATYAVGVLGMLIASDETWGTPLLMLAAGSWLGALVMEINQQRAFYVFYTLREAFQMAGQMVLAVTSGYGVFRVLDGQLPLSEVDADTLFAAAAFVTSALLVYLVLLRLVTRVRGGPITVQQSVTNYGITLAGMLLLPIPFVIAAAESYFQISETAFYVALGVLLMILFGISNYNRAQYRAEQQVRELTRLTRFSNSLRTSLDLETLLQTIYLQVAHLLNVENFIMVLEDPDTGRLNYLMHAEGGRALSVPREGLFQDDIQDIIRNQHAKLVNQKQPLNEIYSWLGAPINASDRTRGAIVVYSKTSNRHLGNDDRRRLSIIAGQIGVAVDNAVLFEESRTRARQLRDLTEVSAELSTTLDAKMVLDSIAVAAKKVMNADASAIFIWPNGGKNGMQLARAVSMSEGFVMMPPMPIIRNYPDEDLIVVADAQRDQRVNDIWLSLANEGKRAWVEALLQTVDEKLGVLVIYFNEPQSLSTEDREILQTLISQAALAINNARLYGSKEADLGRRVDQLSLLQRLSQALFLTTLRLNEMYELVLQRASEGTDADTGVLYLTRDEAPLCVAQTGYSSLESADAATARLVNEVFATGEMVLVPDTTSEKQFASRADIRSQMAIPILHDIQVIGALLLESRTANAFGPEDMFFVMQVGTQARIAIDNVKLIQSISTTRDRFQTILNSMREGILLISNSGEISLANPPIQKLLGATSVQLMGRPIETIIDTYELDTKLGFEREALLNMVNGLTMARWAPRGGRSEYDLVDGNKHRFFSRVDIPVEAEGGSGWLMVFFDTTEEHELERAREDLSHMIVHDLRGPLTAINMGLKLMSSLAEREEGKFSESVSKTTDTAQRAVRKMLNLVNSILDIGKMESGTMELEQEPAYLGRIVDNVLEEMAPLAVEMEIDLINELDSDLPVLDIDSEKIERTLLNLVDNALKFTPGDGKVKIAAKVNGSQVVVRVIDTGPGVPEEHKETLFDRYAQVSGQQGRRRGTGLGLTFCKLTVEAHGGEIWVEDNPEGGTVFNFTLPVLKEE